MGTQLKTHLLSSNHQRRPVRVPFNFTLDGANDPSVFSANIDSVQRLATGTPTIFFRVTFKEGWTHNAATATVTTSARTALETRVSTQHGQYVDAGGDVFDANRDMDVIVFNAAGAGIDTAGIIVNGDMALDQLVRS